MQSYNNPGNEAVSAGRPLSYFVSEGGIQKDKKKTISPAALF